MSNLSNLPLVPAGNAGQNPPSPAPNRGLGLAQVLVLIAGLGIAAAGPLVAGLGLLGGVLNPSRGLLSITTISVSFLALTTGLGLAVAWQAWRAINGQPTRAFRPRRVGLWGLVFVLVVALGQAILSLNLVPAALFPPFHVAAAALPPLIVLGLMGRALAGAARRRDILLQTGSGAFLSTLLAFTLEIAVILGLLILVFAFVAMMPGGLERIQSLSNRLQDPAWLQNPNNLAPLAESPLVVLGTLLVLAGAVPLIEETVKTLGVGLMAYRRPTLPEAVLWGLASGAGFALAEGLFNSAGGLDLWAGVVVLRVGASLLHCFTGALMGLAWYNVLARRRWGRALGLYAASVGVHSLWNILAGSMGLLELRAGTGGPGIVVILILLFLLTVGVGLGLVWLARYAQRNSPPAAAEGQTPLPPHVAAEGGNGSPA